MGRIAIACLTRGYDDLEKYRVLGLRNTKLYEIFYSRLPETARGDYDVLIFHEGNIDEDAQKHIQGITPQLPIQFRAIRFYQNMIINYDLCPPNIVSDGFGMGYKNMCYFWTVDFLRYMSAYEFVIRIDEDCFLLEMDTGLVDRYRQDGIWYASPHFVGADEDYVTVGMGRLFESFMKARGIVPKRTDGLHSPYTNVMIIDVSQMRKELVVLAALAAVEKCGCIFSNRWGDLPIWGYILTMLVDKKRYIEDKGLRYYHASHNAKINFT